MPRPRLRVLLDLSMATRGYCGIAQDARLLYTTLAAHREFDVTGLVTLPSKFLPIHRFAPSNAPRADHLLNQAEFLWRLSEGAVSRDAGWLRWVKLMRHAVGAVTARRARVERLDMHAFWQVIWRSLFSRTVPPDDLPLVQNGTFLLSNLQPSMIYARAVLRRPPIKLDTRGYDFVIVQSPRPLRISPETRLIVRYHDMIPLLQPDSRPSLRDIRWHHMAITRTSPSAFFVCSSEPTRRTLTDVYPRLNGRCATIPLTLSQAYWPEQNPGAIREIVNRRRSTAAGIGSSQQFVDTPRYILGVSTLEPRKNFVGLMRAFKTLRARPAVQRKLADLKLVIVGSPGWRYDPILAEMQELARCGDLIHLEHVATDELRALYSHAEAFVFPSHAEGFGFPPLEAMQCGAPVVASDIPEHRWVLGDAAVYCNSYDPCSIAAAIERLVASDESAVLRKELVARGCQRVRRYSPDNCRGQWLELMHRLKDQGAAGSDSATFRFPESDPLEHAA